MKLKIPLVFSQRDPQWASDFLGFNTKLPYTIGLYGCLITSFGMYVGKKPNEVNDLLKENNGFEAGGGNFIWSKCTVLGLKETYLSPYYGNPVSAQGITKMKESLDQGIPLITHIDFDPSDPDDDQHWLLVIGYDEPEVFYAADPWTGTIITLDVYGGARRCIYQWRCYDKVLPKDEGLDYRAMYEKIMAGIEKLCATLGIGVNMDTLQAEAEKLIKLEDIITEKERLLEEAQGKIKTLQEKLDSLSGDQEKLVEDNKELKTKIEDADTKIKDQGVKITTLSDELKELSKQMTVNAASGWKLIILGIKKLLARG
jgi:hypothetical protein